MEFDGFSNEEIEATASAVEVLSKTGWAAHLIDEFNRNGRFQRSNKGHCFNVRFAHALYHSGIIPNVEIAGESNSTIDFGFSSGRYSFAVELYSLEESSGVKASTKLIDQENCIYRWMLTSDAKDFKETDIGETVNAVYRICQKCEQKDKPHKFKVPEGNQINVLLVDMICHQMGMADEDDFIQIAYGNKSKSLPDYLRHSGGKPILGAFDPKNKCKGSNYLRKRVHFIAFCNEKTNDFKNLGAQIIALPNPNLIDNDDEAAAVWAAWPLKRNFED
jgi:hypothetical protein